MLKIWLRNEQKALPLTFSMRRIIKKSARGAFRTLEKGGKRSVSVLVCDNAAIRELNAAWRKIDKETDVLSFPMEDDGVMLGDIVLSLEKAYSQAEEYGHSPAREIGFLTVHSMLHLYGYDHMEEEERKEMRAMEEKILSEIGLLRGTAHEK